ncbi:MAG TPA: ribosome biogenesis GTPase YlqF [Bacillota bacterium]|nr:ribosome biogenesis GTPase YlqF [Bacillota bacterium]HOJ83640.1 ribosome biogenesis GTPase YlqF [Bacillota bacterium]HOL15778.1 ribosome biogenesis GTPase YlqF [Bacillota bacterium]HPZ11607.1 ribosome biogenesis GTPase YlqF [Bacillota bacterium]HQE09851.1 ribosome biogenesis GTPase YlqF [Bacillota bacterium]
MKSTQWYPGTMARAMRRLEEDLGLVDLVAELIDARAPASSRNPELLRLCRHKERLILLHKADRGEDEVNSRWLLYFQESGVQAMLSSVHLPRTLRSFLNCLETQGRRLRRSRLKRPLRLVIVGIPNVGKSTLINYLAGRSAARTGDQPGITRGRQWFRLIPGVELLDTPGVLPPLLSPETIYPLAAIGALPPGRVDPQQTAIWLLRLCLERGEVARLQRRYDGLQQAAPEAMLRQIGTARGCLLPQGKIDLDRAATILLRDYGTGNLGRLTLEEPPS